MTINIKIDNFEGPFDLLLHLIKKNKMEIQNVKILDVTTQYLDLLKELKEMDLDITSEFILIAATLIEIKSKSLLPKIKNIDEDDGEDPTKVLLRKLIEYNKFKLAAKYLKSKEDIEGRVFTKKGEIIEDLGRNFSIKDILKDVSLFSLYKIYENVISNYKNKQNVENIIQKEINIDEFKVENKMEDLRLKLIKSKYISFREIKDFCSCKMEIVVTFLAMLELIKLKEIKIVQKSNFEDIYIKGV